MTTTTTKTSNREETLNGLVRPFGVAAAAIFMGFAAMQIALALGAPWGDHVWRGSFSGQLPPGMRVVSLAAAVLLAAMAAVVLARAGFFIKWLSTWRFLTASTWVVTGYMALNTLGNLASQSDIERYVFGRATLVLVVLTAYVAYRGPRANES